MTQLPNKRPQGAVLLEMLTPDQQNLVDNTKNVTLAHNIYVMNV